MLAVGSSMLVTFCKKLMCAMLGIIVAVWHQQSHGSLMVNALGRPSNQAVWTQSLAGFLSIEDTILSWCLSPPSCMNGYQRI